MPRKSTKLQKWSQRRNFAKWRLRGVLSHLRGMKYTGELTLREKLDLDVAEKHSPPSMNYNGPGTNVERRLKLLLPKKKLAGKVETGSASYVFPINLQDMVAFEHDLLYATDDPLIQQLADLRYLNYNFKNRGAFIKRVKDLGVNLPDDLKLLPVLVSSAAISSQAYIRSFGGFGKIIQDALIKYVRAFLCFLCL